MTPDAFLDEDNWAGSYCELAIQLGHRGDDDADERLIGALRAMWRHSSLYGCYLDRFCRSRASAPPCPRRPRSSRQHPCLRLGNPPGRPTLVCATFVIREDFGPGDDWLDLGLPTGALERLEPDLSYPIHANDQNRVWREPLDTWLAAIASDVARAVGFRAALINRRARVRFNRRKRALPPAMRSAPR